MYEIIAKRNDVLVVYKININKHKYLKIFFTNSGLTLNFLFV